MRAPAYHRIVVGCLLIQLPIYDLLVYVQPVCNLL